MLSLKYFCVVFKELKIEANKKRIDLFRPDIFLTEINSVTDNPTVFAQEDRIISGGNFHGH